MQSSVVLPLALDDAPSDPGEPKGDNEISDDKFSWVGKLGFHSPFMVSMDRIMIFALIL